MATILFRIRETDGQPVAGASLVLRCDSREGQPYESQRLEADDAGRARLEIPDRTARTLDLGTMRLDLRRGDRQLAHQATKPERTGRGRFRVEVTVDSRGEDRPVPPAVSRDDGGDGGGGRPTRERREKPRTVSGTVAADDGTPRPGLAVRAFDRGVGEESRLGQATTDARGAYRIVYGRQQLRQPEGGEVHLVVRCYASLQTRKPLAESPLRPGARRHETVRLVVPRDRFRGESLFALVQRQIAERGLETKLDELTIADARILAREAGLDLETVEQFVQAGLLAVGAAAVAGQPVPAEPFFGALRAGMPPSPAAFAALRDGRLRQLLQEALEENWIDGVDPRAAVDATRPLRAQLLLRAGQTWVSVLRAAGATDAQLGQLAAAWLRSETPLHRLPAELASRGELPSATAAAIADALEVYRFTGSIPGLVEELVEKHGVEAPADLARLTEKQWRALVGKHLREMPAWVEGANRQQQLEHLAEAVCRTVERSFPTRVFAERWKADPRLENAPVQTWLEKNPDFDFTRSTLAERWEEEGAAPAAPRRRELERTERLFRISPEYRRFDTFGVIWRRGFESARDVLARGRGRFVEESGAEGVDELVANDVFRRAQRVSSHDLLARQPVPVARPKTGGAGTTSAAPAKVEPTLAVLFGDKGGNGCEHCVSATSPSAYLIDMLRFLERSNTDPSGTGKSGLELLFERRPDIANLRLDCRNSDTPLPYVDLVNEVLEHVVATSAVPFRVPADWQVEEGLDLQTTWTAEELAAHPENLASEAYQRLRSVGVAAPWSLPYSLWADEVRTYLGQLSIDRADLMAVVRPDSDALKPLEVAAERLGLDPEQVAILSLPADSDLKRALVWQTADPAADLKLVRDFLRRTGLSYEETADLLATRFVNPTARRVLPDDLSDLETAALALEPADNEGLLDRFHRFARLWRRTGWPAVALDAVLFNVLDGDLDASGLGKVGVAAELHHRFGTPVEELAAWLGPINTVGGPRQPSLYRRSFLDGSVSAVPADGGADLLEEVFRIVGSGANRDLAVTRGGHPHDRWLATASTDVSGEWQLHPDYGPIVIAGCRVSAADVTALVQARLLPRRQGRVALNLANLSKIYRQGSMARALGVPVPELVDWQKVTGQPLGPERREAPGPAGTLLLLLGIQRQLDAGVTAADLLYALQGEEIEGLAPTEEMLDTVLAAIREELAKTAEDFRVDPLTAADRLGLWLSLTPTLVSGADPAAIDEALALIDGSLPPAAALPPELAFLAADAERAALLFGPEPRTDAEERLTIAAEAIPVDAALLQRVELLLRQSALDDAQRREVLAILAGLGAGTAAEQRARAAELLPEIDPSFVAAGDADAHLRGASRLLFDHWVRGPLVVARLAAATGLGEAQVEVLSRSVPPGEPRAVAACLSPAFLAGESAATRAARAALARLYRQAALAGAAELEARELEFAEEHAAATGLFDFRTVGQGDLARWHHTLVAHAVDREVGGETGLYDLLADLVAGALDEGDTRQRLAELLEIQATDVARLTASDALDLAFPSGYLAAPALERLHRAAHHLKRLGTDASQLLRLAEPVLAAEHGTLAKGVVRSLHGESDWRQVSEQLREGLRERQRDALLGFVRTRGGLDLTPEHAYAYYLIDVEMGACFRTSRTKQAIASVQQFVQRILLGLEGDPATGKPLDFFQQDALEWQWRKNYRVWEANVKVFVHPENWLEPELRDDKTPFFEALEDALLQGELTQESAEAAITGYLESLHEVSNLEVLNLYDDPVEDLLHVVARTRNVPHRYYLRTWRHREMWTPWERIETEIEGEHVIPAVHNRRLHLFWPTFSEEIDEQDVELHPLNDEIDLIDQELADIGDENSGEIADLTVARGRYEDFEDDPLLGVHYAGLKEDVDERIAGLEKERADLEIRLSEKNRELEHVRRAHTYFNVELNWILRTTVGWSGKRVSKGVLQGPEGVFPDQYRFAVQAGTRLSVYVYTGEFHGGSAVLGGPINRTADRQHGYFRMIDTTSDLVAHAVEAAESDAWQIFSNGAVVNTLHSIPTGENLVTHERQPVILVDGDRRLLHNEESDTFLGATSSRLDSPHDSFFLADDKRCFFFHAQDGGGSLAQLMAPTESRLPPGPLPQRAAPEASPLVGRRANTSLGSKATPEAMLRPELVDGGETQRPIAVEPLVPSVIRVPDAPVVPAGADTWWVDNHYHPYTDSFLRQVRRFGVAGLYSPDYGAQGTRDAADLDRQLTATEPAFDFEASYPPNRQVLEGAPGEKIDFSHGSAYGQYNWEVFFHAPLLIAVRLSREQRFEEAQAWFHYIFDPTERRGAGAERYWKIKPFYFAQLWGAATEDIDEQLQRVDEDDAMSLESMIDQWEANPFQPFAIARFRIVAFLRATVMKYLDNLIAWGDSLFRRDTMESINEATQLYILAATLLGERPLVIGEQVEGGLGFTVRQLLDRQAVRPLAAGSPAARPQAGYEGGGAQGILGVLDQFCLPYNDRLLEYWDTAADRLFKIRHCQNIDGVFRQLPLFQPPIDPGLLVKAAAAGADLGAVLSDLAAPRPHYRFTYMVARATELAGLAQGLAGQLLSALEKRDAEELGQLRADHEVTLLQLTRDVRQLAVDEARESLEAARRGRETVETRKLFYQSRSPLSLHEASEDSLRERGKRGRHDSAIAMAAAGPLHLIPDLITGAAGLASPVAVTFIGGRTLAASARLVGEILAVNAALREAEAGQAAATGGRSRRQEEWDFQVESAAAELAQFDKQIAAAEVRLALAEKELANNERQIENAEEAEAFLKDKFTNRELYSWLVGQLSGLYFQTYELAYELAKRAELCYRHELADPDTDFVQFGYWDGLKKGLLAGERLQLDLKRMESAYTENNRRELELTKTISLAAVNPEALLRLRQTGECFVTLPEAVFDLDYPGHYRRRIQSVRLTIPAITGPYANVSCTLTLLSDRYRKEPSGGGDPSLFEWNVGSVQSIATSSGQADGGLFQLDFRDERYLPFERAGAVSSWQLSLPNPEMAPFDYSTISDVLLHLSYTARDGGDAYRREVEDRLVEALNSWLEGMDGLPQLLSVKGHFPDAWTEFRQADGAAEHELAIEIGLDHLPYFLRRRIGGLLSTQLVVLQEPEAPEVVGSPVVFGDGEERALAPHPSIQLPSVTFDAPVPLGPLTLRLGGALVAERASVRDLLLSLRVEVV